MKILILTKNKYLGEPLSLELALEGYDATVSDEFKKGYSLYIVDIDSIDVSHLEFDNIITFSGDSKKRADIKRPFLLTELCDMILKSSREQYDLLSELGDIRLTVTERALLELLLENRGKTVSTEEITEKIFNGVKKGNSVNVYINFLRKKIEKDKKRIIITVRGEGFRID